MQRILITGGAGFIGSHAVDHFLAAGYEVGVFDIVPKQEAKNLAHTIDRIIYTEGDIRNHAELAVVMKNYDIVLHLAALVSVQQSFVDPVGTHATNVTGALNVFAAAKEQNIARVVYASSAAVYGDTSVVPTPEFTELKPLSPYGLHKVINESYARLFTEQYGLPTVGLRFFNVYGSRQDPSSPYSGVISIFAQKLQNEETPIIYGDGSATRDFVHVSDVVRACRLAIESDVNSAAVLNLGGGEAVSINQLLTTCNQVYGTKREAKYKEARDGDIRRSCALIDNARDTINFVATTQLYKGLQEVVSSNRT